MNNKSKGKYVNLPLEDLVVIKGKDKGLIYEMFKNEM